MSGVSECFSIGSIVSCTTCYGKEYEGEVKAFDPQTKMLILKCSASNGLKTHANVNIINLNHVSDVVVKKEANTVPEPPKSLNLHRLSTRVRNNIEEKRRIFSALQAGVSPEGQQLYLAISKTITDICWQGPNIVVLNTVTITPPYKLENVRGNTDSKALSHIRKVVEKHVKDQAQAAIDVEGTVGARMKFFLAVRDAQLRLTFENGGQTDNWSWDPSVLRDSEGDDDPDPGAVPRKLELVREWEELNQIITSETKSYFDSLKK